MLPPLLLGCVILNQIYTPFSKLPGALEPDIALLVAIFSGQVYAPGRAAALAFGAGLLQETLAGGLIGVGALSKGLTGLVWARLWCQTVGETPLAQLPLLAALTVVDGAAFVGTSALFATQPLSWDVFWPLVGRQLLANLCLGPFLLMLFTGILRKQKQRKRSSWRRHEAPITFQPK